MADPPDPVTTTTTDEATQRGGLAVSGPGRRARQLVRSRWLS